MEEERWTQLTINILATDVSGPDAQLHPFQLALSLSLTFLKSSLDPEAILELTSPVSSVHCILF